MAGGHAGLARARPIELARPIDTSAEDVETRDRLIRQLEEEVVTLRTELLRRNRTIGDLATRLAAYEAREAPAPRHLGRRPVTTRILRLADPRVD